MARCGSASRAVRDGIFDAWLVMPGLVPGIHVP
jgi:hypothetical protein